jgi:hypothetical protein
MEMEALPCRRTRSMDSFNRGSASSGASSHSGICLSGRLPGIASTMPPSALGTVSVAWRSRASNPPGAGSRYRRQRRPASAWGRGRPAPGRAYPRARAGALRPAGPKSPGCPRPEATAKAMRAGKLALISPVTTSTEGRWVEITRWMPVARASCARRVMVRSVSSGASIIRSASSSIMTTR